MQTSFLNIRAWNKVYLSTEQKYSHSYTNSQGEYCRAASIAISSELQSFVCNQQKLWGLNVSVKIPTCRKCGCLTSYEMISISRFWICQKPAVNLFVDFISCHKLTLWFITFIEQTGKKKRVTLNFRTFKIQSWI